MSDETKEIKLGASVTALGAPELYGTVTQIKDVPDAPDTGKVRVQIKWDVAAVSQYWDLDDVVVL